VMSPVTAPRCWMSAFVATVNPCGFVLLPAYLGLYLGDDRGVSAWHPRNVRKLGQSLPVSSP
jgi:cytochrome c biogenesis protein CcdA